MAVCTGVELGTKENYESEVGPEERPEERGRGVFHPTNNGAAESWKTKESFIRSLGGGGEGDPTILFTPLAQREYEKKVEKKAPGIGPYPLGPKREGEISTSEAYPSC